MLSIACFEDLRHFGIVPLTGEACGLMYRILCDVTDQGKRILEKCWDVELILSEPWNHAENQIGSIMLSREMLVPLGIFALLETGCTEVWQHGEVVHGIEPSDDPNWLADFRTMRPNMRRYSYHGTAGSRNVHAFTGRVT